MSIDRDSRSVKDLTATLAISLTRGVLVEFLEDREHLIVQYG